MAKLIDGGADVTGGNGIPLTHITSTRHEGGGGYNVYTVQSTSIPSGVNLEIQFSLDGGTTWTDIDNGILYIYSEAKNITLTSTAFVRIDPSSLDSSFTGDVVIA